MEEKLIKQIIDDYACEYEDVIDNQNHFVIYKVKEGRRKYSHIEECKLKLVIINSKVIFSGTKEIINEVKREFIKVPGEWFLEPENVIKLEKILNKFGQTISMVHPYYISSEKIPIDAEYEITKYNKDELQQFVDDERFEEAFYGEADTPNVLACSISIDGKIVGMAGASIDSSYLMQIGINVDKKYEKRGIATTLVSSIRNDIIDMGYIAYYGTSFSHIASTKVALKSGFKLSFIELFTMPIDIKEN